MSDNTQDYTSQKRRNFVISDGAIRAVLSTLPDNWEAHMQDDTPIPFLLIDEHAKMESPTVGDTWHLVRYLNLLADDLAFHARTGQALTGLVSERSQAYYGDTLLAYIRKDFAELGRLAARLLYTNMNDNHVTLKQTLPAYRGLDERHSPKWSNVAVLERAGFLIWHDKFTNTLRTRIGDHVIIL
jgi:hypothetical protein